MKRVFCFPSGSVVSTAIKLPLAAAADADYLRPAAVKAGVIEADWSGRFEFHNFRYSLATALVRLKVDPKTVQGMLLHEDFDDAAVRSVGHGIHRDAQGKYLEQLIGGRVHLLTEQVQ